MNFQVLAKTVCTLSNWQILRLWKAGSPIEWFILKGESLKGNPWHISLLWGFGCERATQLRIMEGFCCCWSRELLWDTETESLQFLSFFHWKTNGRLRSKILQWLIAWLTILTQQSIGCWMCCQANKPEEQKMFHMKSTTTLHGFRQNAKMMKTSS